MTIRKWVRLFLTTLLIGGVVTVITGPLLNTKLYMGYIQNGQSLKLVTSIAFLFILGLVFSAVSQMGFFAYLTIHRFGLGFFRSVYIWNLVQIGLILFALIDLAYIRYIKFATNEQTIFSYIVPPILLLIFSLVVASIKSKETNKSAFIPALFFMIVVTIVEWFPALRVNASEYLYLMLIPLFICNTYQLLILHRTLRS